VCGDSIVATWTSNTRQCCRCSSRSTRQGFGCESLNARPPGPSATARARRPSCRARRAEPSGSRDRPRPGSSRCRRSRGARSARSAPAKRMLGIITSPGPISNSTGNSGSGIRSTASGGPPTAPSGRAITNRMAPSGRAPASSGASSIRPEIGFASAPPAAPAPSVRLGGNAARPAPASGPLASAASAWAAAPSPAPPPSTPPGRPPAGGRGRCAPGRARGAPHRADRARCCDRRRGSRRGRSGPRARPRGGENFAGAGASRSERDGENAGGGTSRGTVARGDRWTRRTRRGASRQALGRPLHAR
jgi:hypothetical protein